MRLSSNCANAKTREFMRRYEKEELKVKITGKLWSDCSFDTSPYSHCTGNAGDFAQALFEYKMPFQTNNNPPLFRLWGKGAVLVSRLRCWFSAVVEHLQGCKDTREEWFLYRCKIWGIPLFLLISAMFQLCHHWTSFGWWIPESIICQILVNSFFLHPSPTPVLEYPFSFCHTAFTHTESSSIFRSWGKLMFWATFRS